MSGNRVPSRADFLETKYGEKFNLLQKHHLPHIAASFELEGAFFEGPQKFYISRAHEKSREPRPLHNSF